MTDIGLSHTGLETGWQPLVARQTWLLPDQLARWWQSIWNRLLNPQSSRPRELSVTPCQPQVVIFWVAAAGCQQTSWLKLVFVKFTQLYQKPRWNYENVFGAAHSLWPISPATTMAKTFLPSDQVIVRGSPSSLQDFVSGAVDTAEKLLGWFDTNLAGCFCLLSSSITLVTNAFGRYACPCHHALSTVLSRGYRFRS